MKRNLSIALLVAVLLSTSACQQEYLNPSSASETQAVTDVNGLLALANGLQYRYTISRTSPVYNAVTGSGLSTRGLVVLNAGNTDEDNLGRGGANVRGSDNAVVRNLWQESLLVNANADLILNNLGIVTDAQLKASLQAHASIFKALSLGTLAQFFEQVPISSGFNAAFSPRADALREAIRLLETAQTALGTGGLSPTFTGRVVTGIDIPNTLNALIARYALFVGDFDKALAAAAKVDLTKRSEFRFDDNTRNPIFETALSNVNVYQPTDLNLGLPAALAPNPADRRLDFYFQSRTPTNGVYRGKGFFTANNASIPVYLPGEISLIKAEAYARKNDLDNAIRELNVVLTKTTDAWGLGAALPAYAGARTQADVLTEIYRNRRIELFMSGLELEDSRRFGRPAAGTPGAERTRNWYPYPQSERDNNTATPADPAI
jgi:hypothetical protein